MKQITKSLTILILVLVVFFISAPQAFVLAQSNAGNALDEAKINADDAASNPPYTGTGSIECGTNANQEDSEWGTPDNLTQDPACLSDPAQARNLIGPLLNWGLTLLMIGAALTAFIMLIWGAYKYISAQGDAAKAAEGRQTIQYAVVGIIILAVVYLGVVFYNTLLSSSAGS